MKKVSQGKRNKQRGYELEAEFVRVAEKAGLEARRFWCSDGRSAGHEKDVDVEIEGYLMQCKRKKKLPDWLSMPTSCDFVGFREDRGERFVMVRADFLFELLQERKER